MSSKGRLFIISAPSGTGKTTVLNELRHHHPELEFSVSCTTRPMREGEKDGVDYHFIDRTSFEDMVKNDGFAEWAEVHGHLYGTTRAQLEAAIREGRDLLLDIDVQGGMSIKRAFPEAVAIFLLPPSMEVLKQRLSGRATDSPEQIRLRLENARHELTFKDRYDHTVVNDAFQRAAEEIARIMGLN